MTGGSVLAGALLFVWSSVEVAAGCSTSCGSGSAPASAVIALRAAPLR